MALTADQARAISATAYVFLFPLVASYRRLYADAIDPSSPTFTGGIGRWAHRREVVSQETDVAVLHDTALHSAVWLDLESGPWTVSTGDVDAAPATELVDLWGFGQQLQLARDPRPVLVAENGWVGEVPADVGVVVRTETRFVRCEVALQMPDPGELAVVRAIQRSYQVALVGDGTAPAAPRPPGPGWWPVNDETLFTHEFWPTAAFALSLVAPHEEDRDIMRRLAEIGVLPGARWRAGDWPRELLDALDEGMDDALSELMRAARGANRVPRRLRPDLDRDYFGRAIAALGSDAVSAGASPPRGTEDS